jgi:hypothetical protein
MARSRTGSFIQRLRVVFCNAIAEPRRYCGKCYSSSSSTVQHFAEGRATLLWDLRSAACTDDRQFASDHWRNKRYRKRCPASGVTCYMGMLLQGKSSRRRCKGKMWRAVGFLNMTDHPSSEGATSCL